MTLPALPPEGSTNWYAHYEALDEAVRNGGSDDRAARKVWTLGPDVAGDGYSPEQRTAYLRAVFAEVDAAGGGTIEVPGVEYVVARTGTTPGSQSIDILLTLPADTILVGRAGSAITLDPATAGSATGLLMVQFGGSNITVRDLAVNCNETTIGGGSVWAIGSRRDSTDLTRVDNIHVGGCIFTDTRIAVTAAKGTPSTDLGTDQYMNWTVENCTVDTCSNRAIELQALNGGRIVLCTFTAVETAIQIMSFARNVQVIGNIGTVNDGALRINYGVTHCDFKHNRFTYLPTSTSTTGCVQFHSEPDPTVYTTSHIQFEGNYWGATSSTYRRSVSFFLAGSSTDVLWTDISWTNDIFEGDVRPIPAANRPAGEAANLRFTGCEFFRDLQTIAPATYNVHDVQVSACWFKSSTAISILSSRFAFLGCRFAATPTIGASADRTIIAGSITPTAIVSAGTNTQLSNNLVLTT